MMQMEEESGSLLHDAKAWRELRAEMARRPDSVSSPAELANRWSAGKPITIVEKKHAVAGEDPHDYRSIAPYWWPDPASTDGLPYIRRDGEVNPEFYEYDQGALEAICQAVPSLVHDACLRGSAEHARRAGQFLRVFFLNPGSRMNPHLRFAQAVRGRCDGRGIGIIDTDAFVFLLDAVTRLPLNEEWTANDLAELKRWFSDYLDWLLTSDFGATEEAEHNNHGSWYDAQIGVFALFCGRLEEVGPRLKRNSYHRLETHIAPDGGQPAELSRTMALTYTTFNLLALACAARVGMKAGLDLWRYETANGAGLEKAVRWMLPFYMAERPWSYPQINPFEPSSAALLLNLAWEATGLEVFATARAKVEQHPWQRFAFLKGELTGRTSPQPR